MLHWQVNLAGHERDSLGTVMRSFFLEHEIRRGATSLMIYGGTPHPMRHAFERRTVSDLLVRRRGLRGGLLLAGARLLVAPHGLLRRGNFLASALHDPDLQWQTETAGSASQPSGPMLLDPRRPETLA